MSVLGLILFNLFLFCSTEEEIKEYSNNAKAVGIGKVVLRALVIFDVVCILLFILYKIVCGFTAR